MLALVTKDNIHTYNDVLRRGIKASLECDDKVVENTIKRLEQNDMSLWVAKARRQTGETFYGFAITFVAYDAITEAPSLVVYVIYSVEHLEEEVWRECINDMKLIAKNHNCSSIKGYTSNSRLLDVVKRAGFQAKTLVYLEV